MRFMMKVNIPVGPGNKAAKAGKLSTTIQSILAELKPEAAYFSDDKGQRTGYLFFEMTDTSQIPEFAEPWFLSFDAAIEFHPVMVPDDLAKAAPAIPGWCERRYGPLRRSHWGKPCAVRLVVAPAMPSLSRSLPRSRCA